MRHHNENILDRYVIQEEEIVPAGLSRRMHFRLRSHENQPPHVSSRSAHGRLDRGPGRLAHCPRGRGRPEKEGSLLFQMLGCDP